MTSFKPSTRETYSAQTISFVGGSPMFSGLTQSVLTEPCQKFVGKEKKSQAVNATRLTVLVYVVMWVLNHCSNISASIIANVKL